KTGEHEAVVQSERGCLTLEVSEERPLADKKETRPWARGHDPGCRIDQVRIPFRVVQPRDGSNGELALLNPELTPRIGDLSRRARPAEFFERHTEVHDLHLRCRNLTRPDDEFGRALRDGERDVGKRLERAIRDLLEPRSVGE